MNERKKGTDHPPAIQVRRAALGTTDEDAVYSVAELEFAEKLRARDHSPKGIVEVISFTNSPPVEEIK